MLENWSWKARTNKKGAKSIVKIREKITAALSLYCRAFSYNGLSARSTCYVSSDFLACVEYTRLHGNFKAIPRSWINFHQMTIKMFHEIMFTPAKGLNVHVSLCCKHHCVSVDCSLKVCALFYNDIFMHSWISVIAQRKKTT